MSSSWTVRAVRNPAFIGPVFVPFIVPAVSDYTPFLMGINRF
jgi:hypothetical protein